MKKLILAGLLGLSVVAVVGCVDTVSDTHTLALAPGRDTVSGRYQRTLDQVYDASIYVVKQNGVVVKEIIPHNTTNMVRALEGSVNDESVWIRCEALAPRDTRVDVQARSKWGGTDLDLVHELEKEIALQLAH